MGRVYEALKRAAEKEASGAAVVTPSKGTNGNGQSRPHDGGLRPHSTEEVTVPELPEHLLEYSPLFNSASTAHTERQNVGTALADDDSSRAAGATLDAVGATRALDFDVLEISAARVEPHLIAITQPHSPNTEIYRSLRTRLIHAHERRNMQAFVVTSAGPAEGKTMTAMNLAWLLAQSDGVRALLIEGDMRRPCTADYLGINGAIGLSEVLAGEAKLTDAIVKLEPAGLYLLPGGSPRDNVAEILSGSKFSSALAEARQMFNFIIIDAPPLGIFSDASILMNRADGALLVIRSGQTRYTDVEQLLAPLKQEKFLGVVLNGAPEQADKIDYYQRRYYRSAVAASPENVAGNGQGDASQS